MSKTSSLKANYVILKAYGKNKKGKYTKPEKYNGNKKQVVKIISKELTKEKIYKNKIIKYKRKDKIVKYKRKVIIYKNTHKILFSSEASKHNVDELRQQISMHDLQISNFIPNCITIQMQKSNNKLYNYLENLSWDKGMTAITIDFNWDGDTKSQRRFYYVQTWQALVGKFLGDIGGGDKYSNRFVGRILKSIKISSYKSYDELKNLVKKYNKKRKSNIIVSGSSKMEQRLSRNE